MILDILLVIFVLIFVVVGTVRGGVKTLLSLAATFIAFITALLSASWLSSLVYDSFISQRIVSSVAEEVTANSSQAVQNIGEMLPEFIKSLIAANGIDLGSLAGGASQSSAQAIGQAVERAIAPTLTAVLTVALLLIIFILLRVILALIIRIIDRLFELPVLKQFNRALGFICGLAEGVLVALLIISVIKSSVATGTVENIWLLNQEYIDSSFIFKAVYSGRISDMITNSIL